jgi:prostaglandin-endoperoxide synthase 2
VRQRGVRNAATYWAITNLPELWGVLNRPGVVHSTVNDNFINQFVMSMEPRPPRLTTMSDYTSWASETDKTYDSRHLPPWPKGRHYPKVDDVAELFDRRVTGGTPSEKSTLLFPFFAQWFVDGFLRSDPGNPLRNVSTLAIDLCQLYGLNPDQTKELRGENGELQYQEANDGGELPPPYDPEKFESLRLLAEDNDRKGPRLAKELEDNPRLISDERAGELFAVPLPRGNVHYGMLLMSTIFLREHNRVARRIRDANPCWGSDRIFETARNVLIVMLHKVVIEEYLNHITPFHFQFSCEPGTGADRVWFRPNWMSIEFDLLYRWHALMPDAVDIVPGDTWKFRELLWYTRPLREHTLAELISSASSQRCMEIGLFNTPWYLLQAEKDAIQTARCARLAGYNDYRAACHYPRLQSFADVTSNQYVQKRLSDLYDGSVDNLEFYVGLFAEDVDRPAALPMLMGTMVGVDAFSQALTNPLLDPRIFSAETFSEPGLAAIKATSSLRDIVERVVDDPVDRVTFDATDLP